MSEPFRLAELPALSRATVDRQEALRSDPARLRERWPDAHVLVLDERGRTPVRAEDGLPATRRAATLGTEPPGDAMFLGEDRGTDYWALPDVTPSRQRAQTAIRGDRGFSEEVPGADGELWFDLRGQGDLFDDTSAGLVTTAVALRNWHRRAGYCARCGGAQHPAEFGWSRLCESCGRQEFPRTDPAVICLVHDDAGTNGEHVLLARQPAWPHGRFSVLAGFVEAGESLEDCVSREIREEVSVDVSGVRYLGSQPWPFPRSIMLGFAARADSSVQPHPADGEIAEAYWITRAEVREALAAGEFRDEPAAGSRSGRDTNILLPGNSSIARVMLEAWAGAGS